MLQNIHLEEELLDHLKVIKQSLIFFFFPQKCDIYVKNVKKGGGAASSRPSDEGSAGLDFNAVQRGDAEMENKMNRVVRACLELRDRNPIVSIHDQGAGNVLYNYFLQKTFMKT